MFEPPLDYRYRYKKALHLSARRKKRCSHLKTYWKKKKETKEQIEKDRQVANELDGEAPSGLDGQSPTEPLGQAVSGQPPTEPGGQAACGQTPTRPCGKTKKRSCVQASSTLTAQAQCETGATCKKRYKPVRYKIKGRRIIDINYFLIELQKLNKHSEYDCSITDLVITAEDKIGLLSCFYLKCKACHFEKVLWTEDPNNESVSVNSDAVAGLLSIGCGFWNMKELFAKMCLPTFSCTMFSKEYEKQVQNLEKVNEEDLEATEGAEEMLVGRDDYDSLVNDDEIEAPVDEIITVEQVDDTGHLDEGTVSVEAAAIAEERVTDITVYSDSITAGDELEIPLGCERAVKNVSMIDEKTVDAVSNSCNSNESPFREVSESSGVVNLVIAPCKDFEEESIFPCKDCHIDFRKRKSLQMHKMSSCCKRVRTPPSSTVTSQAIVDDLNSCTELSQTGLPATRIQSRLAELKSAIADKKSSLDEAVTAANEVQQAMKLQPSAKEQKEKELKALKDAESMEKELADMNRRKYVNHRLFVSDLKTQALSGVQRATAYEKFVQQSLSKAIRKHNAALESAVEATAREQLALVELSKALEEENNCAVLSSETKLSKKTRRALQ